MSTLAASTRHTTGAVLADAYLRRAGKLLTTTDAHDIAAFCRWLAARRPDRHLDAALRAFGTSDLETFIADQLRGHRGRRRDPSTVYRRLVAVGRFYAWAATVGAVPVNPVPPQRRARADRRRTGSAR